MALQAIVLGRAKVCPELNSLAHLRLVGNVTIMLPPAATALPRVAVIIILLVVLTVVLENVIASDWRAPGSKVTTPAAALIE